MAAKHNMQVMRRVIEEAFSAGNYAVLEECYTPTWIEHQFDMASDVQGLAGAIRYLRETFAPFSLTINHMVAEGDKVWLLMTGSGTHSREFMGKPPTGKPYTITVMDVCRFENGKIVEHWGVPDRLHLMTQLGVLPQRA